MVIMYKGNSTQLGTNHFWCPPHMTAKSGPVWLDFFLHNPNIHCRGQGWQSDVANHRCLRIQWLFSLSPLKKKTAIFWGLISGFQSKVRFYIPNSEHVDVDSSKDGWTLGEIWEKMPHSGDFKHHFYHPTINQGFSKNIIPNRGMSSKPKI